jgi:hypothetical protein
MRLPDPFYRVDNLRKKGACREARPLVLSAISRLKRLLQGVNAGAEVNVKGRSIHH